MQVWPCGMDLGGDYIASHIAYRVLHIASCCMAYYMAQQFTTPTMFSTIKSIQLFQLRKFYDNCLIVRLVLHCTALLKAPHIITITIFKHWISFYMKSQGSIQDRMHIVKKFFKILVSAISC